MSQLIFHLVSKQYNCTATVCDMIFTLAEGVQREDAHLLNSRSNGKNVYNLTAKGHKLYVAVDKKDNVIVVDEKSNDEVYICLQTEIIMKCV